MLSRRILNWKLCGFGGTLNLMGFCGRSKLIYYEKNFQTSSPLRSIFRQSTIWLFIIFVFLVKLIKLEFVERVESPAHFPHRLKFIEQLIWHSWLADVSKVATFLSLQQDVRWWWFCYIFRLASLSRYIGDWIGKLFFFRPITDPPSRRSVARGVLSRRVTMKTSEEK